jgi:hypothetical protein
VDILISKASRLRQKYNQVTSQCKSFQNLVEKDPDYKWLTKENLAMVIEAEEALAARMTDFEFYMFSGATAQDVKKSYTGKD